MFILFQVAYSCLNVPYKWGGNNPIDGLDCSGFVQHVLKSAGIAPPKDCNAQCLYDYYELESAHNTYKPGALVFYGKSILEITHVALMLDPYRIIEAAGGDHLTLTRADAAAKGAMVRIRKVDYRNDKVAVLWPRYAAIGII